MAKNIRGKSAQSGAKMNIGYEFKNKNLLKTALTHISLANEMNTESNQRLEFLGDSILSFVVAEYIYERFTGMLEGQLHRGACGGGMRKIACGGGKENEPRKRS